jgi:hypothetical protein
MRRRLTSDLWSQVTFLESAPLIQGFFGAEIISLSAEFALGCRRARALLAGTWLCPRNLLSLT